MQFNNLKRNKTNRKAKQVGRGGTRGKTSGKGTKGQNARSGRKKRPEMRDTIKRLPKLRGRGKNFLKSRHSNSVVVKLAEIESKFNNGEVVNTKSLIEKGLIKLKNSKKSKVKILGGGEIKKPLTFEGLKISLAAQKLIDSSGGKISK